jgi:hypothetical protein
MPGARLMPEGYQPGKAPEICPALTLSHDNELFSQCEKAQGALIPSTRSTACGSAA